MLLLVNPYPSQHITGSVKIGSGFEGERNTGTDFAGDNEAPYAEKDDEGGGENLVADCTRN